jgi:hypothetical protein
LVLPLSKQIGALDKGSGAQGIKLKNRFISPHFADRIYASISPSTPQQIH